MVSGTIIVTDADERAALAVDSLTRARGLARRRAAAGRPLSPAGRATAAPGSPRPIPSREPHGFADAVVALARKEQARYVIPISEASLLALLPNGEPTCRTERFPGPALEAVRAICDKRRVLERGTASVSACRAQRVVANRRHADLARAQLSGGGEARPFGRRTATA